MNKILIFLGGLVSGFGLGVVASNLVKTKKEEEPLEVIEFNPDERKKVDNKFDKPELDQLVKKYRTDESNYNNYSTAGDKKKIQVIEEDNPYPPEDYLAPEDDEPEEEDDEEPPEVEFSVPIIVSRLEFENEKPHYEVQCLTYYAYDDTVCDEQEQVVSTPEDLLGDDALVCFGLGSDNPNVVYICNDKRGTKYEVTKVNGSYQETVLGMKDADLRFKRKDYILEEESDADLRFKRKDYLRREDVDTD